MTDRTMTDMKKLFESWYEGNLAAMDLEQIVKMTRELARHKENISRLQDIHRVQSYSGNWNYDYYTLGMFNGLELALSIFENREPDYRNKEGEIYGNNFDTKDNVTLHNDLARLTASRFNMMKALDLMGRYIDPTSKDGEAMVAIARDALKEKNL